MQKQINNVKNLKRKIIDTVGDFLTETFPNKDCCLSEVISLVTSAHVASLVDFFNSAALQEPTLHNKAVAMEILLTQQLPEILEATRIKA